VNWHRFLFNPIWCIPDVGLINRVNFCLSVCLSRHNPLLGQNVYANLILDSPTNPRLTRSNKFRTRPTLTWVLILKIIGKGFVLFKINSSQSAFYIIKPTCISWLVFKVGNFMKLSKSANPNGCRLMTSPRGRIKTCQLVYVGTRQRR